MAYCQEKTRVRLPLNTIFNKIANISFHLPSPRWYLADLFIGSCNGAIHNIALKPYRLANYTSSVSPTKNMVALSLTLSRNSALLDIWLPSTNAP